MLVHRCSPCKTIVPKGVIERLVLAVVRMCPAADRRWPEGTPPPRCCQSLCRSPGSTGGSSGACSHRSIAFRPHDLDCYRATGRLVTVTAFRAALAMLMRFAFFLDPLNDVLRHLHDLGRRLDILTEIQPQADHQRLQQFRARRFSQQAEQVARIPLCR